MSDRLLEAYLVRPQICSNPVFIIGSPRSGTTALALALGQHSHLWASGESHILSDLFGEQKADKVFQKAKDVYKGSWLNAEDVDRSEFLGFLGLGLNALFSSRSQGKRWVDQTPHYGLMGETLAEMFPGAYFLHIIRDGRRVVHSMTNFKRSSGEQRSLPRWVTDFAEACRTWRRNVEACMALSAKYPTRCLTVVNEELVDKPRQVFSEIFRLLAIPYEDGPIEFIRTHRVNSSFSRQYVGQPPPTDKESIPWKEWSVDERSTFLAEAGPTMASCGFVREDELTLWSYDKIVLETRDVIRNSVPVGAKVAVVSKGDDSFLHLDGRTAYHFPQNEHGAYAGHHPADSAEVRTHLDDLRRRGIEYLVFPSTSLWWLEYYEEVRDHLNTFDHLVLRTEECVIYRLRSSGERAAEDIGKSKSKTDGSVNGAKTRSVASQYST